MSADAGAMIREARRRARLSQTDLARRAGVAQSVVSAYESGQREPSLRNLTKLIEATGHELTLVLGQVRPERMGLPDTRLGRRLRYRRRAIAKLAAARGAHNVRLFGSVARGEESDESDVDLLVDLDDDVGLIQLVGLRRELTDLLGIDVDVVPSAALKPRVRDNVLAEAIAI
jgi:uncharacterized protein